MSGKKGSPHGFASMSPERVAEISRKGNETPRKGPVGFAKDPERAKILGAKGGRAYRSKKGNISNAADKR